MACKFFASVKFDLGPLLQGQVGHHIKKLLYLPMIRYRASKCENDFEEIMAYESFPNVKFDL